VPAPRRPQVLHGRVFRKRDVVAAGLLTTAELRSSAWRRLYRGVYADATIPDTFDLRISGAALLVPAVGAFSGRSAAYLHGATDLVDGAGPVEVSVPPGVPFGPVAGIRVCRHELPDSDVTRAGRRRLTTRTRTALDIARREPLVESVVALDVLLRRDVIDPRELQEAVAAMGPGRGTARARRAASLADGRSESPPESRLRVLLTLAGLPAVPQHTVRDTDGTFVARVDLAFPDQRVAVEYDGAWHGAAGQLVKDRRRLNRLVAAGWTVVHVTAAELRDPAAFMAQLRRLLAGRNFGEVAL
jgi:G:T-mismatch repair DNA endonuclease (very short patch repair protein)